MKNTDTPTRIILTAIDLINEGGTEKVTTRSIAERAKVNSAAVNYHFGSREQLIGQVLRMTMSHLFEDLNMILAENALTIGQRFFSLLDYMMEGICRYPGLTRSYMFDESLNGSIRHEFLEKLSQVLQLFSQEISSEPGKVKLNMGQAVLSSISVLIIPESFRMLTGEDISSQDARRAFILPLVNRVPGVQIELNSCLIEKVELLRAKTFK